MAYAWSETIDEAVAVTNEQVDEIRTNINTERTTRAGLGAYDWAVDDLDSTDILSAEVAELRTAIDAAYDLLWDCASHYSTDDSGHFSSNDAAEYTSDDSSHDSSVEGSHYSTDDAGDYGSEDAADYSTHNADHDSAHYATHYGTNKAGYNSSYKSWYNVLKCGSYYKLDKEMFKLIRGKE